MGAITIEAWVALRRRVGIPVEWTCCDCGARFRGAYVGTKWLNGEPIGEVCTPCYIRAAEEDEHDD